MSKHYHLFISHSWTYSDAYDGLTKLLKNRPYFYYSDYSVPKNDPIHTNGTDKDLKEAIERKIGPCGVVIILAGVYSTYSKWINKEIDIAQKYGKPILAIEPWGSERTSTVVKNAADRIVKWNTESIVAAIRELD
ncbi:TIR domain-containing protein [Methanoculleus sp. 7T]|uniref:TIR domain-containing protein n=1 Tax=Methanoculleus sp. 7T TaxID=2937282 RepID=UPI0020BF7380|nr:TIR domain-containing protein [Methanoculleus sp. 7T]MCK8517689.1 TIR domain-containing protein [Methanoculleus sp. 7T]